LVEKNNLKLGLISKSLSPNLSIVRRLTIVNYFNRSGSNDCSSESITSSIIRGKDYLIQFSTDFSIPSEPYFITFNPSSIYKFFIHLLAYYYGSMNSGYCLQYYCIIPLLIETESFGNPLAPQF
jgi:hypothetical protein